MKVRIGINTSGVRMGRNLYKRANGLRTMPTPYCDVFSVVSGGPLEFHATHASNVELSHAGRRAKRLTGQRGLCFSQRPILPGERVCLKVTGLSHEHNNKGIGLRYGYTAVDPSSDDTMQHSGHQELVATEHGYWLKTVSESVVKRGSVLVFCLCIGGEVYYGRNDEEYGMLFAGVRTDLPLWVVVDLSGSARSLEFVGKFLLLLYSFSQLHWTRMCQSINQSINQ